MENPHCSRKLMNSVTTYLVMLAAYSCNPYGESLLQL